MRSEAVHAIDTFWTWFGNNEPELREISGPSDRYFNLLLAELQRIDDGLYCEVCTNALPCELIVTTAGYHELFPLADSIVAHAPRVEGWEFFPLKPAMGFDFKTSYEHVILDPEHLWFLPLENASQPMAIGLRIGVPEFTVEDEKTLSNAVLLMLDTGLGEREAAEQLAHVEVGALPDEPEQAGYIELVELPTYLEWMRKRPNNGLGLA